MTDDEAAFVEALSQHMYGRGMPRMPARLWAWLLICDPAEQTASQVASSLHASRGAISAAVRDLSGLGLIRRSRRRGSRQEFLSAPNGHIRRLLGSMETVLREGREIADEGLVLIADRPPTARARLQEFRDAYAHFEREWPAVVRRYFDQPLAPAVAELEPAVAEPQPVRQIPA